MERVLTDANLELNIARAELRTEAGSPVPLVVTARKKPINLALNRVRSRRQIFVGWAKAGPDANSAAIAARRRPSPMDSAI